MKYSTDFKQYLKQKSIRYKAINENAFAINVGYLSAINIDKRDFDFTSYQVDNETMIFKFSK